MFFLKKNAEVTPMEGTGVNASDKNAKNSGTADEKRITDFQLSINNCTAEDTVFRGILKKHSAILTCSAEHEYYDLKKQKHISESRILSRKKGGRAFLMQLRQLLDRAEIEKWDGFDGAAPKDVLDGSSMTFLAHGADGSEISASGNNNFPKNYHTFESELYKLAEKSGKK